MKEETLRRLLSLIQKTGDRLVITDPAGEHPYVLMGLEHYEKLVVGEWKPEVLKREPAPPQTLPISTSFPDNKPPKREIPLWKSPSDPAPTSQSAVSKAEEPQSSPVQAVRPAPVESKPQSAEQNEDVELEGEERFYLEPLE